MMAVSSDVDCCDLVQQLGRRPGLQAYNAAPGWQVCNKPAPVSYKISSYTAKRLLQD